LTRRDFATRHGVGLSTLSKWLRVGNEAGSPPMKFQEVILPNTPMLYAVEVGSTQGGTVRLQNSSEIETLAQLLQALPC